MRMDPHEPGGESVKQAPATERAADHRFLRDRSDSSTVDRCVIAVR
jgi:hypothetical protein